MIKITFMLLILVTLNGCSTVSNNLPSNIADKMKECTGNKTTLAEIFCKKN
jgi:uncharacterized protein YceK